LFCEHYVFVSLVEPSFIEVAINEEYWVMSMHDKLNQFKWVFKNNLDEHVLITRNKARLVTNGHNQQAGIAFGEAYT